MRRAFVVVVGILAALTVSCSQPGGRSIYAEFLDVGDLVTRANVQSSDAVVGYVASIELVKAADGSTFLARVEMQVDPTTSIPEGTNAVVRATSLLGEKYIDLIPPADANETTPQMSEGATILASSTRIAPDLETAFQELGAILASGALTDLATFVNAQAVILEGRADKVGDIFDRVTEVVDAIHSQRSAVVGALEDLNGAAATFADNTAVTEKFLTTSEDALRVLASQREQLRELLTQLGRVGDVGADVLSSHFDDVNTQIESIIKILPEVVAELGTVEATLPKLGPFAELFARAAPGDYIQLDISVELPNPPTSFVPPTEAGSWAAMVWEAAR